MEDLTPLYNKEFYLAHLCGEDVALPIPDGNAERYLAYLCGMDVTIPDVPDGRTETYLAYKCGEDVVLPDPMYRIEFYLAKWCGIDCEVPEPLYRIEYWLAQLANSGELKTVTGNPISVSDALAKPAESLVVDINAVQSGSGDPSPSNVRPISGWSNVNVTRTGKNLYDISNKTASSDNTFCVIDVKPNTDYTFSVDAKQTALYVQYDNNGTWTNFKVVYNKTAVTFNSGSYEQIRLMTYSSNASNIPTQFQLELGSTATAYEPYSGASVEVAFGQTVYGGTLDVTTGVLTVDRAINTLDNSSTYSINGRIAGTSTEVKYVPSPTKANGEFNFISSHFEIASGTDVGKAQGRKTSGNVFFRVPDSVETVADVQAWFGENPTQIVYHLATPITIQLTPTEIEMLEGNNTLWADTGDITLTYMADGNANDVEALNILLGNRYVNLGEQDEATDREALEILLGGNTR